MPPAAISPAEMRSTQLPPLASARSRNAEATAADGSISGYGFIAVMMAATATYRNVQTNSEARIPMGMSRFGLFASWAWVDTASKPMKAKKTTPPAPRIPMRPP